MRTSRETVDNGTAVLECESRHHAKVIAQPATTGDNRIPALHCPHLIRYERLRIRQHDVAPYDHALHATEI
jgi:hypothetical protein